ncbi:hypothetical protein AMTR_s00186p00050260 [Amborella trichopoda]|uniref:Uncharacterized protein n=1 Tax=Amborella trichopoda TaxID=13333 RepID=W1PA04_AMBTC|nr:hypothetical protein AMTR_s00186p00050260 [Amborella trichopoda]
MGWWWWWLLVLFEVSILLPLLFLIYMRFPPSNAAIVTKPSPPRTAVRGRLQALPPLRSPLHRQPSNIRADTYLGDEPDPGALCCRQLPGSNSGTLYTLL